MTPRLVAVDFEASGSGKKQALTFETHVGDLATAGQDHPIRIVYDDASDEPSPYVLIRSGLEALIDRKSFYRLVELGEHHDGSFGVWSEGVFFPMLPSEAL